MSRVQPPNPPMTSWLGWALGIAGGFLLAGAAVLARSDVADLVQHRVEAAGGALSPDASAWLRNAGWTVPCVAAGLALLALSGAAFILHPRLVRACADRGRGDASVPAAPGSRRSSGLLALGLCAAVFVRYHPTLGGGFFRYDDFQLVSVAGETPLWASLWQPHGDHFMPLTRLLYFLAWHTFGVAPWPYNLAVLLSLCAVLVSGCRLLRALEVSPGGQLIFAGLVLGWSPLAEMMAGYYVLSTYLLIAALGLVAIERYLRWQRTRMGADVLLLSGCIALAPLIDVSGWYVSGAGLVFVAFDWAEHRRELAFGQWLAAHRLVLAGLALAIVLGLALTCYDYVVLHPGVFLDMASNQAPRSLLRLGGDVVYLFTGGALLSMAAPFVYARLPGTLLLLLLAAASTAFVAFLAAGFRAARPARRWRLVALLSVALGVAVMVAVGRPTGDAVLVRWAAKHVCPVYFWVCLSLAVGWDALWSRSDARRRLRMTELTIAGMAVFLGAQLLFGQLGLLVDFPPFGYPAEIRNAKRRRLEVHALQQQVIARLVRAEPTDRVLPTLDGPMIQARFPSLFRYNLSFFLPFFGAPAQRCVLVRSPAMQSWHSAAVRTVPSLRTALPAAVRQLLVSDSELRAFYFGPVELVRQADDHPPPHSLPPAGPATERRAPPPPGVPIVVESDGRTEITVRESSWDPETRSHLRLAGEWRPRHGRDAVRVTVSFWSQALHARWTGSVVLPPDGSMVDVDLLQAYAFSLSDQVADLHLTMTTPGRYRFTRLEIGN